MKETLDDIFKTTGKGDIFWITGNSGAGKTTLAKWMNKDRRDTVILDGDYVRQIWPGLGFSKEDREENNLRVARLALFMSLQGVTVIVSTICPFAELRKRIKEMTGCRFIYLSGGKAPTKKYPYEQKSEDE